MNIEGHVPLLSCTYCNMISLHEVANEFYHDLINNQKTCRSWMCFILIVRNIYFLLKNYGLYQTFNTVEFMYKMYGKIHEKIVINASTISIW